jgi:hypothetical protein
MRNWSRQLEHGFGQLVLGVGEARRGAYQIVRKVFGIDDFSAIFIVVCGRAALLDPTEEKRFA